MKTLLLTAALTLAAAPCSAMFCNNGVICEGDTQMMVLKRCGDFDYITNPEYRYEGTGSRNIDVKRTTTIHWVYNFGPRRFIYTVTFEGGRVVRIEPADYGW
jgi:hypothetical protein